MRWIVTSMVGFFNFLANGLSNPEVFSLKKASALPGKFSSQKDLALKDNQTSKQTNKPTDIL